MIDKIDRPEAPLPYRIGAAKDAKENQHQQSGQREEQEKKYQKQLTEKAWSKFDRRTTVIKPIRTTRDKIARCLFKSVNLHSGIGTLTVDVIWKDNKATYGALVLLKNLEDFIHLKKFTVGQEVPDTFWSRDSVVDLGIVQVMAQGGTFPQQSPQKSAAVRPTIIRKHGNILSLLGIVDGSKNKIDWGIVALYLFFLALTVSVIAIELK